MVSEVNSRFVKTPSPEDVTFKYLFDNWITGLSLTTDRVRAATTQYQERRRFERHVVPRFGNALIAKTEPVQIKRFYNELRTGRKDQQPLSTTSVARIHETLRAMCAWGVEMEMISDNPFQKVKRPKVVVPAPRPPETDAVGYLLNELWKSDRKLWLAVRLAATTGARRSELAALRWLDVRWKPKGTYVTLDKGLVRVPQRGTLRTETKTGASGAGQLKVDEALSEALKEQYLEHLKANDTDPRAFIFASDKAGQIPWHPDTFTAKIRRANDSIGRGQKSKRITFKSLRAYTASELASQGRDVTTAQAVLRHKSAQTTLRHYSAARERNVREATEGVGDALSHEKYLHRYD
jgi:integrase